MDKRREVTGILVTYSNGEQEQIEHGCCVNLKEKNQEEMCIEMLGIAPMDIVRLAYGLLVTVDKVGLMDAFKAFATGGTTGNEV